MEIGPFNGRASLIGIRDPRSVLVLLIAASLLAQSAGAAPIDSDPDTEVARRHFAKGSEAYLTGSYEVALEEFEKASEAKPNPAFVFNIARCLDRLERYEEAIGAYERFVAAAPADSDAPEARRRVDSLRQRLASRKLRISPTPPVATAAPPSPAPAPAVPIVNPPPVEKTAAAAPTSRPALEVAVERAVAQEEPSDSASLGPAPKRGKGALIGGVIGGVVAVGAGLGIGLGVALWPGPSAPDLMTNWGTQTPFR